MIFLIKKKKKNFSFLYSNNKNDFDSTDKKTFSKKQILVNLINNKDYMIIKKKVKLGELQIPKKLCI